MNNNMLGKFVSNFVLGEIRNIFVEQFANCCGNRGLLSGGIIGDTTLYDTTPVIEDDFVFISGLTVDQSCSIIGAHVSSVTTVQRKRAAIQFVCNKVATTRLPAILEDVVIRKCYLIFLDCATDVFGSREQALLVSYLHLYNTLILHNKNKTITFLEKVMQIQKFLPNLIVMVYKITHQIGLSDLLVLLHNIAIQSNGVYQTDLLSENVMSALIYQFSASDATTTYTSLDIPLLLTLVRFMSDVGRSAIRLDPDSAQLKCMLLIILDLLVIMNGYSEVVEAVCVFLHTLTFDITDAVLVGDVYQCIITIPGLIETLAMTATTTTKSTSHMQVILSVFKNICTVSQSQTLSLLNRGVLWVISDGLTKNVLMAVSDAVQVFKCICAAADEDIIHAILCHDRSLILQVVLRMITSPHLTMACNHECEMSLILCLLHAARDDIPHLVALHTLLPVYQFIHLATVWETLFASQISVCHALRCLCTVIERCGSDERNFVYVFELITYQSSAAENVNVWTQIEYLAEYCLQSDVRQIASDILLKVKKLLKEYRQ